MDKLHPGIPNNVSRLNDQSTASLHVTMIVRLGEPINVHVNRLAIEGVGRYTRQASDESSELNIGVFLRFAAS
jgi:hypothetical protein